MFSLIFAKDDACSIGSSETNALPWPREAARADMKHFKETTTGNGKNAVIMGHNTFLSLPKSLLPNRALVVVSRYEPGKSDDFDKKFDTAELVTPDLREAFYYCMRRKPKFEEVFVIGGGRIYERCMKEFHDFIYKIYMTTIAGRYGGDITCRHWVNDCHDRNKWDLERCFKLENCDVQVFRQKNLEERVYLDLLNRVLALGEPFPNRTGVGTRALFGETLKFDLSNGRIPLLTTKRVFFRGSLEEMLFFISGSTDVEKLRAKNVHIWDGNTTREFLAKKGLPYPEWDMGPTYSFMFKHAGYEGHYTDKTQDYDGKGTDQFQKLIDGIRTDPYSRRHMINLWSPAHLDKMSLPPCLFNYIFHVSPRGHINVMCTMRSADLFLGVPFNLSGACLLLRMVCHLTNHSPGQLMLVMSNAHIYENHVEQVKEQIARVPYSFPLLEISDRGQKTMDDFAAEDFELLGYRCHAAIKAPMAV